MLHDRKSEGYFGNRRALKKLSRLLAGALLNIVILVSCTGKSEDPRMLHLQEGVKYVQQHTLLPAELIERNHASFMAHISESLNGIMGDEGGFVPEGSSPWISEENKPVRVAFSQYDKFPKDIALFFNAPGCPWSLVIKRDVSKKIISLEGYGDDLLKPLFEKRLRLH